MKPHAIYALMAPLVVCSVLREEEPRPMPGPVPEPARRPGALPPALAGLAGGLPLPPTPRPGSGRERHVRRINARRIAKDIGLDVEHVYQALGRGESEAEIRARRGGA